MIVFPNNEAFDILPSAFIKVCPNCLFFSPSWSSSLTTKRLLFYPVLLSRYAQTVSSSLLHDRLPLNNKAIATAVATIMTMKHCAFLLPLFLTVTLIAVGGADAEEVITITVATIMTEKLFAFLLPQFWQSHLPQLASMMQWGHWHYCCYNYGTEAFYPLCCHNSDRYTYCSWWWWCWGRLTMRTSTTRKTSPYPMTTTSVSALALTLW